MKYNNIKSLLKSFSFAIRGFIFCVNNERNFRIHLCISFFLIIFASFYGLSTIRFSIICIMICIVLCMEMINTCIEQLVDLYAPSYNNIAKVVKDIAAGAVFLSSVISIIVAAFIFDDIYRIRYVITNFLLNPFDLSMLIVFVVLSYCFIFKKTK